MSSPSPPFWCHSCHRIVGLSPPRLVCPLCSCDFVEELSGGLSPHPPNPLALFVGRTSDLSSRSGRTDALRRRLQRRNSPDAPPRSSMLRILEIMSLLSSHAGRDSPDPDLEETRAAQQDGRTGLDVILPVSRREGAGQDPAGDDEGSRRLVDARDFFLGTGLDLLFQQLIDGDGGRYGSPPASKASVEAMPTLILSKQSVEADEIYCAVCKEMFEIGGEVREMPCKHLYHSDCILPWLALHSSCPICRHEMPTEDHTDSDAPSAEGNSPGVRTRTEGTGERGLAIVGITGVGMHVRSIIVFGIGRNDDPPQENQNQAAEAAAETVNSEPESAARASTSSDFSTVAAEPSTSGNDEQESVASDRHASRFSSGSRQSGSGSQAGGSGSRRFFSWLFRNSSSHHASTSGAGQQASSSDPDDGDTSANSSRGKRFGWLLHSTFQVLQHASKA